MQPPHALQYGESAFHEPFSLLLCLCCAGDLVFAIVKGDSMIGGRGFFAALLYLLFFFEVLVWLRDKAGYWVVQINT
ncbi:hypothetical protein J3F83DRAFT_752770 [Trichoderma novae-zelandiae]